MCWDLQNEWLKSSKWTVAGPFIPLLFSVFTLRTALEFQKARSHPDAILHC